MLRNMLGPMFNLYLDQFLTYTICDFLFFPFWGGGLKPLFLVFSAKHAKIKETQKRKKTLFVNTTVLIALVKMSFLFFSAFFIFAVFAISIFSEMFLTGFQKSKNNKIAKQEEQKQQQQQQENKMQSKKKSNMMIQNKTRQQAETKKTKQNRHLETKKQTKQKEKARKNQIQK